MRELIQKGDPRMRIQLSEVLLQMIQAKAKENKRRVQDQLIKSLAETLKNEQAALGKISENPLLELEAEHKASKIYAQVIPREMMEALKNSAQQKGVSFNMEIIFRLEANMSEQKILEGI